MASRKVYKVCIVDGKMPLEYPHGFFPRGFHYKNDAVAQAHRLVYEQGVPWVRVEFPDGRELDVRKKK